MKYKLEESVSYEKLVQILEEKISSGEGSTKSSIVSESLKIFEQKFNQNRQSSSRKVTI